MAARRIYLASSWRNPYYFDVLAALRAAGHVCYDFRNPAPGNKGFAWSEMDPEWQSWSPEKYASLIHGGIPAAGFALDKAAMDWADTCVLLLPSGRSAHIEAGYMVGRGKPTFILLNEKGFEPELMYLLADGIHTTVQQVVEALDCLPEVHAA